MCSEFNSKYITKNKIGEGTFSEVLKCKNISTGQFLAVKKLKKYFKHFCEAEKLPELMALVKLPHHQNVLSLIEYMFDPHEGKLYMIFELMDMSLYDLIRARKRCLPESKVKHIFYQILKGLDHLHTHGIFHRDIKPENILLKKSVVKLADLGSVRGTCSHQPFTEYISTRWYRAPECILTTGIYGPKMDIWACGCVYYELLTNKPIFPGANEIDQLTKIHQIVGTPNIRVMMKMRRNQSRIGEVKFINYPSVNLSVILPFTSESGREILKRMLMYDPDVRASVRRLLEHKYFNDLREAEYLAKHYAHLQPRIKQWSTPSLFNILNTVKKPKPKPKETGLPVKKIIETKLTTNSWGPATNTSKVDLAPRKSKPNNVVPLTKKRSGQTSVKPAPQKPSIVKSDLKQPSKSDTRQPSVQRVKANSFGQLPALSCKLESLKLSKSQVSSSAFKILTKGFLPPIPEH